MKFILKKIGIFIVGALFGVLAVIVFAEPILKHSINKDIGLGIIAIAPIILLIWSVLSAIIFGTISLVVHTIWRKKFNK